MSAKIARNTWVKISYVVFILIAGAYGLFRFNVRLREAYVDDGVQNQLRNLYAIARDYSAEHGNQLTVQVSDLDQAKLFTAGIRPPLNGVFPSTVILGGPLKVTAVDGQRTVVYEPGK